MIHATLILLALALLALVVIPAELIGRTIAALLTRLINGRTAR